MYEITYIVFLFLLVNRTVPSTCRRWDWALRWTARITEPHGDFGWPAAKTSELLWSFRGWVTVFTNLTSDCIDFFVSWSSVTVCITYGSTKIGSGLKAGPARPGPIKPGRSSLISGLARPDPGQQCVCCDLKSVPARPRNPLSTAPLMPQPMTVIMGLQSYTYNLQDLFAVTL